MFFSCLPTDGLALYVHQDPKLLQTLVENRKRSIPYAGAFLVKDDEGTDSNTVPSSDSEKNIHNLKGKELLKRLHDVGTLAQVLGILQSLWVAPFTRLILTCACNCFGRSQAFKEICWCYMVADVYR
jgi:hypothetical protein